MCQADPNQQVCHTRRSVHSFVQLAVDGATGRQVAVKFLRRDTLDATAVLREVQNQRACAGHPHIVQLLVSSREAGRWMHSTRNFACSGQHHWCRHRTRNETITIHGACVYSRLHLMMRANSCDNCTSHRTCS